jgi:hypothetical protein
VIVFRLNSRVPPGEKSMPVHKPSDKDAQIKKDTAVL